MTDERLEEAKNLFIKKHELDDQAIETAIYAITTEQSRRANTNLCASCQWGCMAECPQNDDIVFGNGKGNDNVVECVNYINETAYKTYSYGYGNIEI